ncbi:hypothetical protein GWI33_007386 [Rhynchophorus ferrugineus]|uniref:Uncharacterized protein n=1 Tax=Rhynchophorus ferrugineus TaxID=354439 RepID=A0A834J2C4_RHYFE|nr:hypothetical protein GWI33_007386 [Rhynchophorus ferrugineus]
MIACPIMDHTIGSPIVVHYNEGKIKKEQNEKSIDEYPSEVKDICWKICRSAEKICTQEQIIRANKLIEEEKSKRTVSEIIGIDDSTLRKRLKLNYTPASMGRCQEYIYSYCKASDERYCDLTLNALRKLIYEFVEADFMYL